MNDASDPEPRPSPVMDAAAEAVRLVIFVIVAAVAVFMAASFIYQLAEAGETFLELVGVL